jgi:hypothetical protein
MNSELKEKMQKKACIYCNECSMPSLVLDGFPIGECASRVKPYFIDGAAAMYSLLKEQIEWVNDFRQFVEEKLRKAENEKITTGNRCLFAKQNETLGESKARHNGFISALLVVKDKLRKIEL